MLCLHMQQKILLIIVLGKYTILFNKKLGFFCLVVEKLLILKN
jgi:hypothetical protein